jgi:hypothetical protein
MSHPLQQADVHFPFRFCCRKHHCEISGSLGGKCEDYSIHRARPTFQRCVLPPSSGRWRREIFHITFKVWGTIDYRPGRCSDDRGSWFSRNWRRHRNGSLSCNGCSRNVDGVARTTSSKYLAPLHLWSQSRANTRRLKGKFSWKFPFYRFWSAHRNQEHWIILSRVDGW